MDWEGSPSSSSPQSQQRASPQRSPPRTTTTLPSSSTTPSSFVMLPPPRTSSPSSSSASVVRAGAASRARVSPSSLSPTASPSHSQSHSSNIIVTHVSSAHDVTNTSSPAISLSSSPLELTGPRSKHPQVVVGSTSPSRSPSAAPHSYSLSGPKSPVVLISSTTSSASSSSESSSSASLNSWKSSSSSVAGRLQLSQVYHHHHHHPEFHSQTRNPTTTSTTDETNSCGAVALVAANKTTIQDQPEELVVTPTSSSSSSSSSAVAGQQKQLLHNQGVPLLSSSSCSRTSSTSPVSSSISSTLLLRRHRHAEAEVEEETGDKEQKHPTDLSNPTKTTSQQHQKNSRNEQCDEQERRAHQQHQHQKQPTSSSSSHQVLSLSIRKNKPIPPPLDLSIGASSLSLHHHQHSHHNTIISSNSNTTINTTNHNHSYSIPNAANQSTQHQQQIHNPQQQPTSPFFLGSPKFADKSLPLRKRWQSWSPPTQMNGQEHSDQASAAVSSAAVVAATGSPSSSSGSSMVPLYSDSQQQQHHNPMASKTGLAGVGSAASVTTSGDSNNGTGPGSAGIYGNRSWVLDVVPLSAPPITTSARNSTNHHHHHHHHPHGISTNSLASSSNNTNNHTNNPSNTNNNTSSIPNSLGLHTPTPFFTPNEPSPKFMNSPVFSYSNPDTSLYQGPFSPIRASSLYPPPSSPFTNLSLNSPLPPLQSSVGSNSSSSSSSSSSGSGSGGGTPASGAGGGIMGNPCFNMIPSTLLSPAPSQASTNSLSYEDLHEKSLSCFTPVWSVFMSGTKVRFVGGMNSMDWYLVDFLAQSGDSLLGLKGEYAPHGLEVRKLVMTSSPKERVQLTFCPVADPNHPTMEVNCEPGHPFMVDKKGWCAVKPEVFQETYGALCQQLECGDICLNLNISRSPNNNNNVIAINNNANFLHHQQSLLHHNSGFHNSLIHGQNHAPSSSTGVPNYNNTIINTSSGSIGGVPANVLANMHNISHLHSGSNHINNNNSIGNPPMGSLMTSTLSPPSMKMETIDEKPIPISVLPQNPQSGIHMSIMQSPPPPPMQHQQSHHHHQRHLGGNGAGNSRKTSAAHSHVPPGSPAKRAKDGKDAQGGDGQPAKGRRPMNAFLLFAKDKRPELIQKYPGKDNRTISVLLGEAWQKLAPPERERYSSNAKARAEEQKRIHPDCWKRKRSQSTSS